jgi:hypothetical protein
LHPAKSYDFYTNKNGAVGRNLEEGFPIVSTSTAI